MKNYSLALSSLVKRIVEEIKTLRVILFGSVARNTMSEQSDIDLQFLQIVGEIES